MKLRIQDSLTFDTKLVYVSCFRYNWKYRGENNQQILKNLSETKKTYLTAF